MAVKGGAGTVPDRDSVLTRADDLTGETGVVAGGGGVGSLAILCAMG